MCMQNNEWIYIGYQLPKKDHWVNGILYVFNFSCNQFWWSQLNVHRWSVFSLNSGVHCMLILDTNVESSCLRKHEEIVHVLWPFAWFKRNEKRKLEETKRVICSPMSSPKQWMLMPCDFIQHHCEVHVLTKCLAISVHEMMCKKSVSSTELVHKILGVVVPKSALLYCKAFLEIDLLWKWWQLGGQWKPPWK